MKAADDACNINLKSMRLDDAVTWLGVLISADLNISFEGGMADQQHLE